MQKTKTTDKQEHTETTEEVPSEVNEQSAQVSEDAACCLADIDALLEECKAENVELTDQQIVDAGFPDAFEDFGYHYTLKNDEWQYDEYHAAVARFEAAYLAIHGVEYDPCVC